MPGQSGSSFLPSPSPSCHSLRSSERPYPFSQESKSTSAISLSGFEQQRPALPHRDAAVESNQTRQDPCSYSRRQLNIEAVHCIYVDESGTNGATYTFLVKPALLQTGRCSLRFKHRTRGIDGTRSSEQITRVSGDEIGEEDAQQELEPYRVERSSKELLDLSTRLLNSFDMLLDTQRGGPQPLTRDFLLPKWNVKDIFKRKKKAWSVHEAQLAEATSVAKIDVINDFFVRVLQTGGEVLSSSRAMQDFFDKSTSIAGITGPKEDRAIAPSRRPQRPTLTALQIDEFPACEVTEHLTASPSWQSTPLSTPVSSINSESKHRLWRKLQAEALTATPTPKGRPGFPNSASLTEPGLYDTQAEIMAGSFAFQPNASNRQDQLHSLIKSISQQDLRSDLASWRQEVNRASIPRQRLTSQSSSMRLASDLQPPTSGHQSKSSASPDSIPHRHSVQLRQVSAIAVKAKASGWKIVKGSDTPIRLANSKSPAKEHTASVSVSPCQPRKLSHSSIATSHKSESQPYVPSELERLIFGNGTQQGATISSPSLSSPHTAQSQRDLGDVEHLQEDEGGIECEENKRDVMSNDRNTSSTSTQSQHIASYKVKGRASVLRLNLSGRSNLLTDSMIASAALTREPISKSPLSIVSYSSERNKIKAGLSNESLVDSDNLASPKRTPSSATTNLSCRKFSGHSTQQREQIPPLMAYQNESSRSLADARIERNERTFLRHLTVESCCPEETSTHSMAIEREVQQWKAKQNRRRI